MQPDTLIPDYTNPQAWNRYSYTLGNPIKYNDPSGHGVDCGIGMGCVSLFVATTSSNSGGSDSGGNNDDGGSGNDDDSNPIDELNILDYGDEVIDYIGLDDPFSYGLEEFIPQCPIDQPKCIVKPRAVYIYFDISRINSDALAWELAGLVLSITGYESVRKAAQLSKTGVTTFANIHTGVSLYTDWTEGDSIGLAITVVGIYPPASIYSSSVGVIRELSSGIYEVPVPFQGPPAGPYCDINGYGCH